MARDIAIVIIVLVVLAAAFAVALFYYFGVGFSTVSRSSTTNGSSGNTLSVTGTGLVQTLPVGTDSSVNVSCNYCQVTLNLASGVTIRLDVTGSYNTVNVNSGQTYLEVSGNFNTLNVQGTSLLSQTVTGNGNTINK